MRIAGDGCGLLGLFAAQFHQELSKASGPTFGRTALPLSPALDYREWAVVGLR
jgi:hypothetical protein